MNTLNKVLLALLLVGVSVSADLQAMDQNFGLGNDIYFDQQDFDQQDQERNERQDQLQDKLNTPIQDELNTPNLNLKQQFVQGAGKALKALGIWAGSVIVAANLPYASISSTALASLLSNATYIACVGYAPYYIAKKMVLEPVYAELREKRYLDYKIFKSLDDAIEFIQDECKVGRKVGRVVSTVFKLV